MFPEEQDLKYLTLKWGVKYLKELPSEGGREGFQAEKPITGQGKNAEAALG